MIENDLEHKKLLLDKITGRYYTEGPLPPLQEIYQYLTQMNPEDLGKAIYLLEYKDTSHLISETVSSKPSKALIRKLNSSQSKKSEIEKLFIIVAEHFKRNPNAASPVVDQLFHYFYRSLIYLVTQQGLISYN